MNNITCAKEDNIIVNTVVEKVTVDDIFEHIKNNVETWRGVPVLWDFSRADLSDIDSAEWQQMVTRLQPLAKIKHGEKTALVSSIDLAYGMMRMLDIVSEGKEFPINLESFKEKGEAIKWLLE